MIPIKFANMVCVESNIVQNGNAQQWHVLLLLDEANRRVLPIWIGRNEADALVGGVLGTMPNTRFKRPVTWNFVARLLEASGATLEHVVISALRDEVFYATARLHSGDNVHEIDARPSDAIPLALMMNKPLYASADEISAETWWPVPDDLDITGSLLGVGTEGLDATYFGAEPIHLDYETTLTESEWQGLDDETKAQYSQAHQQALRDYVFTA